MPFSFVRNSIEFASEFHKKDFQVRLKANKMEDM